MRLEMLIRVERLLKKASEVKADFACAKCGFSWNKKNYNPKIPEHQKYWLGWNCPSCGTEKYISININLCKKNLK